MVGVSKKEAALVDDANSLQEVLRFRDELQLHAGVGYPNLHTVLDLERIHEVGLGSTVRLKHLVELVLEPPELVIELR